jgi:hypothetical protein
MGAITAIVFGLLIWIIGWALGFKAFDMFLITILIALLAATVRMLSPYAPGKRE